MTQKGEAMSGVHRPWNGLKCVVLVAVFAMALGGCEGDPVPSAEAGERVTLRVSGMT